jgi:hypothetical protein
VYDRWDNLTSHKESKSLIGFDLARALDRSNGVFGGTSSIIEGSKTVQQADDLEMALRDTAEALERETAILRPLDFRRLPCLPTEPKLPRGRLQHIDKGGGQVDMVVSYNHPLGRREALQLSDIKQIIRLPERSTNVEVRFLDRTGKMVYRVDRAFPKQGWVVDTQGHRVVETCHLTVPTAWMWCFWYGAG